MRFDGLLQQGLALGEHPVDRSRVLAVRHDHVATLLAAPHDGEAAVQDGFDGSVGDRLGGLVLKAPRGAGPFEDSIIGVLVAPG